MTKLRSSIVAVFATSTLLVGAVGISVAAEKTVEVGGAPMYPSKNIIENFANSKDHTTLVAAAKAGGLIETLSSPGPFTLFAPSNAAFEKLPAGTVDNLLKPEKKAALTKILTYHVVPGKLTCAALIKKAKSSGNKTTLTTVHGSKLTVSLIGSQLFVTDESGTKAEVSTCDVDQSNGVVHLVDALLLPNEGTKKRS